MPDCVPRGSAPGRKRNKQLFDLQISLFLLGISGKCICIMLTVGNLANIKHVLQKELFHNSGERILSVVTVTKTWKRKRACHLCVVSTNPPVPMVSLVLVKQSEQRDGEYKRKRTWKLDEIKFVDGRNESFETHEFDMQVEKLYKWYALDLHERQNFLAVLHKQIQKCVRDPTQRAEYRHVPLNWLLGKSPEKAAATIRDELNESAARNLRLGGKGMRRMGHDGQLDADEDDDNEDDETEAFAALTEKEAHELSQLFERCDFAIKDTEQLIEQLTKELQDLDGANIQSVLTSEKQVLQLMGQIDIAIQEADEYEQRLNGYVEIMSNVRETMEKIGGKNAMIEIANHNNTKLMETLEKLIVRSKFQLI